MNKKTILSLLVAFTVIIAFILYFLPLWVGHADTKMQQAAFEIEYIADKLNAFYQDHGNFPNSVQGLKLLTEKKDPKGQPYLVKVIIDPWGHEYHYLSPGRRNLTTYDLWTYGSDNKPGGNEDHSRDITNWD